MTAKKVTPSVPRLLYSRKSAAHALDVSVRTLDYLIARGKVKTRRVGTRIMIPALELERFASEDHPEPVIEDKTKVPGSNRPRRLEAVP